MVVEFCADAFEAGADRLWTVGGTDCWENAPGARDPLRAKAKTNSPSRKTQGQKREAAKERMGRV